MRKACDISLSSAYENAIGDDEVKIDDGVKILSVNKEINRSNSYCEFTVRFYMLYLESVNFPKEDNEMEQEKRIAVMAIIVENRDSVEELNTLLHEYGNYIVGRMGLPYEKKNLHIVSIALDAPNDTISALAGKIGNISGISVKTAYASV